MYVKENLIVGEKYCEDDSYYVGSGNCMLMYWMPFLFCCLPLGNEAADCKEENVCAPVHIKLLQLLIKESGRQLDETFGLDGICSPEPFEGVTMMSPENEIPVPLTTFPLIGGNEESWPVPIASGVSVNVDVVADPTFGL